MSVTVAVQAHFAAGRVAPAEVQALSDALVPVAARLGVDVPRLEVRPNGHGLDYVVRSESGDEDTAFREQCRQVGLVFALSRVRPDGAWVVRAQPPLLADAAGAPRSLWIQDGAVVLRHADAPQGQAVIASPALSACVVAELVHGLGADQLRWLGVAVEQERPSRRAALEARRAARRVPPQGTLPTLDGPVAGAADTAPLMVHSLDVKLGLSNDGSDASWVCSARLQLEGDAPVDEISAVVRLRAADGRLLDVAESPAESVSPGQVLELLIEESSVVPLADAAAADAWFALHRTHRVTGRAPVYIQEQ